MISVSKNILGQLSLVLNNLSTEEYSTPLEIFSGASISQHTRHILEFFTCLTDCKNIEVVNYDLRQRDIKLEKDLSFTISKIEKIICDLDDLKNDHPVILEATFSGELKTSNSSLHRELLYAIEHAVHHMAIIKMGILLNFPKVNIPQNFGVAESTIMYRNKCAQ